jgi:hypothetical protein
MLMIGPHLEQSFGILFKQVTARELGGYGLAPVPSFHARRATTLLIHQ